MLSIIPLLASIVLVSSKPAEHAISEEKSVQSNETLVYPYHFRDELVNETTLSPSSTTSRPIIGSTEFSFVTHIALDEAENSKEQE